MRARSTQPMLAPAVAVVTGTWCASHLPFLPIPALAGLTMLGLARGARIGRWLAWGALAAALTLARGLPGSARPAIAEHRPLAAEVTVAGHVRVADGGVAAWVRVARLRQGGVVEASTLEALLTVPWPEGRAPSWAPGTRLRVRGYLRRAAVYRNGGARRPAGWRLAVPSPRLIDRTAAASAAGRLAAGLRARVETAWSHAGETRPATGLARALLLGEASAMPEPWLQGLRRIGLGHLLAVSGLHLALAVGAAMLAVWWLPARTRPVLGIAAAWLYLMLVGSRPSVLRAAWMAVAALLALLLARPPVARNVLALSVLALVLRDPLLVDRLAFRLTAAATLAIVVLVPPLQARWRSLPPPLRAPLAATVAAQAGTAPFAVPAFAWLPTAGVPANLVALPWLAVTMTAYGGATVIGCLRPAAGIPALPMLDLLARPVAWLAALPAGPWLGVPVAAGTGLAALAGAVGLALVLGAAPLRLAAVLVLLILVPHTVAPRPPELVMLDVGQGDALLLRDGARAWLVDGGGWPRGDLGGRVLVPALAGLGVRRLDGMLLTHADRDHCRGLIDLGRYLHVGAVWMSPHARDQACGDALARRARALTVVRTGDQAAIGRWQLRILHAGDHPGRSSDNDRSIVATATVHGWRVLLTGDIEAEAERRLAAAGIDLRAEVLKVAHHGSRTSTGQRFLSRVAPRWALISAGRRNPFGHPAEEVLARLQAARAQVVRTDRDGAVRLVFAASRAPAPEWLALSR